MNVLIDILGSSIIGSYILLMSFGLNLQINSAVTEKLEHTIIHQKVIAPNLVMEFDLFKIGYGVEGPAIQKAGPEGIRFLADIGNDGVVDTVGYAMKSLDAAESGNSAYAVNSSRYKNAVKHLLRTENGRTHLMGVVSKLEFRYLDATGAEIPPASLADAAVLAKIRSLRLYTVFESQNKVKGSLDYAPIAALRRVITPKNL